MFRYSKKVRIIEVCQKLIKNITEKKRLCFKIISVENRQNYLK